MFSRSLTPQQNDRNIFRQVFAYAASVLGGIAPDDLPSFEKVPGSVDWTNTIRGVGFQKSFINYVNCNLEFISDESEAMLLKEVASLKDKMFDRISELCLNKDRLIVRSLPNVLLIASQIIEEQAEKGVCEFGHSLYMQANGIWNASAKRAIDQDPTLSDKTLFIDEPPPRFHD